jgi:hypothetical protein
MSELALINMNLPARVWLPISDIPHFVVRIPYRSAAVLNSKEKVKYLKVFVGVYSATTITSYVTTPL